MYDENEKEPNLALITLPGRVISCFNASAKLCTFRVTLFPSFILFAFHSINVLTCAIRLRQQRHFPCPIRAAIILSKIVQALYAVRSGPGRHAESLRLDQELDKWYFELPDHLRYDSARSKKGATPPPHVLVLHMQYWCVVLLLHRPL